MGYDLLLFHQLYSGGNFHKPLHSAEFHDVLRLPTLAVYNSVVAWCLVIDNFIILGPHLRETTSSWATTSFFTKGSVEDFIDCHPSSGSHAFFVFRSFQIETEHFRSSSPTCLYFTMSLQEDAWIVSQIRPKSLPFK